MPSMGGVAIARVRSCGAWCATGGSSVSADERQLADRVVTQMMARDAFGKLLGMEIAEYSRARVPCE